MVVAFLFALALEEIGIRRYGDDQKSLFSPAPVPDFQITGKSGKKTLQNML